MAKKKSFPAPVAYRYRLLHSCNKPGAVGCVGAVITLTPELHDWFQQHVIPGRGAVLLETMFADGGETEVATNDPADSGKVEFRKA